MADASLQDRLREHSKAFDGLLSLIPAKMYYGEDNSEQWKKKKQTKAEAKAAKTAKLDPDSELNRNAKEVMDERARSKRKLQDMQEEEDKEDDDEPIAGVQRELPGQGLRNKENKKQKTADPIDTIDDANPAEMSQSQLMRLAKKEAKTQKRQDKKEKKAAKKAAKAEAAGEEPAEAAAESKPAEPAKAAKAAKKAAPKKQQKKAESTDAAPVGNNHDRDEEEEAYETVDEESDDDEKPSKKSKDVRPLDVAGMDNAADTSGDSTPQSPTFDAAQNTADPASTTTSTSSTVPPSEKPKHIKLPADTSALRARLAARIEALRAARKADGADGKPIRTRAELIEARRAKQNQRKEHKKELRRQAKLAEEAKREEALASNSPSVMSPRIDLDRDDEPANYAFGRVAFEDGTKLSHDLSHALTSHKKKGPSDPKTALIKIQNQKKRLAALDKEKQADIAEKEQWLIARRRAEGEKIRDDEGALKRAVKRKEQTKKKSEKAWKERSDGVAKAIREKQKKRDDNIKKRKDDKLAHKLGRKSGKKVGGGAKKARPGFEGSFGGGKKKK
ncbi:Ribosomal RNA-processing protein 14 [Colletotrichum siamense]|uniref:Ribosomal RNA-processing protein 14 n=1 Tax=Colletotrichum siamense TaxID=690259 RepID=UPI001872C67F|nr:Ribosomal RNA-processing protein 14 [Colletotrichum siamense]KAF5500224.1 Ribosomal RNA-processing protein 14 [Colletotrichum siamense]